MKTEREKMIKGELYNVSDPILTADRQKARLLIKKLNDSRDDETVLRSQIICDLFGSVGDNFWIGEKPIIGAGSVVTKNIPSNVCAAGNPCKIIRELDE